MTVESIQYSPLPIKEIPTVHGIVLLLDCSALEAIGLSWEVLGVGLDAPLDELAGELIIPLDRAVSYAEAWGRLVVRRLLLKGRSS